VSVDDEAAAQIWRYDRRIIPARDGRRREVNTMKITALSTAAELDAAVAASAGRPLLLLKHSLTCGTSAYAHEEFEDFLSEAGPPVDACVVHVQSGRAVSNAIAERFGIRHQSPQLFLIVDGRVVWHASHHRITRREIAAALDRHAAPPSGRP
jgi:bacillithiol system protein YtxJ